MAINVFLSGCSGRMGEQIKALIKATPEEWTYSFGLSREPKEKNEATKILDSEAKESNIVIDFSSPEGFETSLNWAVSNNKPFLSGTTGLSKKQEGLLQEAAEKIPVLLSANTSLGVNFVNKLLKSSGALKEFDFQIVETHHNKKLDAPSGTAKLLQKTLNEVLKKDIPEPLSIRGGGVFGEHEVLIMSDEEVITIKHTALNRTVFAKGALFAAKWLSAQSKGYYSMSDVFR